MSDPGSFLELGWNRLGKNSTQKAASCTSWYRQKKQVSVWNVRAQVFPSYSGVQGINTSKTRITHRSGSYSVDCGEDSTPQGHIP